MDSQNVYEEITEKMINILEGGNCPWVKPWKDGPSSFNLPESFKTRKLYRGINSWILWWAPYRSNLWGTFKQLLEAGYPVRKGEKATKIIFWKILEKESVGENGKKTKDKIPLLKTYSVFNVDQTEGFPEVVQGDLIQREVKEKIEDCEKLISSFPLGMPEIQYAPGKAFYSPSRDVISIPSPADYENQEYYYHTLFHESIHATGHKERLNRESLLASNFFGDDIYSQEELVAEMGASFLDAFSGIGQKTIENSAAYLRGWINALRGDSKLIIRAAAQAQKATDYLMNVKFEEKDE